MGVRKVGVAERRARLARRHHLATDAQLPDPTEVARAIVAYHATDPASVYLAAAARTGLAPPAALERALYEDRTLIRTLGMRRTMFVLPTDQLPVVQAACTEAIAVRERRRTLQLIADGEVAADPAAWLATVEAETLRALAARGEATTSELGEDVPALRAQVVLSAGKAYEATATMAPRVLFQLSAEGKVVRGRPVRSWVSNYRWALTETWLPDRAGRDGHPPPAEAETELARGWLAAFGPGSLADLKWWTGWPASRAKRTLEALGAVEVTLDAGEQGYVLPDDLDPVGAPEPWAAFLPGLDPAVMGWAMPGRDWYLGERCRDALYAAAGTSARPCGGTAGWSAGGRSAPTGRWSTGCWRTWTGRAGPRSPSAPVS